MIVENRKRKIMFRISLTVLLILVSIIVMFPVYFMIIASLKDPSNLFKDGLIMAFDFSNLTIENYIYTLTGEDNVYLYWYGNSLIIMILSTVVSLTFSAIGGYGLAAYDFKLKKPLFRLVMIVMIFPLEIMLLPLYKMIIKMGFMNTKIGSVLPFLMVPTAIFFFRQYIIGISRDFLDAGRVDGCTEFGIFVKIIVPQLSPAIGAMTILLALRNWNAFLWPLIVFNSEKSFTLPVGLSSLLSTYGDNYELLIPGSVLALVPLIIIFLLNQRQFIEGLSSGGIKG